jgi:hypothetical protein
MGETRIPNFNTMADLFDRLIVCVNKLAYFENKKREEQGKSEAYKSHESIAHWDNASRNECEIRNLLKREIDAEFKRVVESGQYPVCPDFRTFSAPDRTISDILSAQCDEIGTRTRDLLVSE